MPFNVLLYSLPVTSEGECFNQWIIQQVLYENSSSLHSDTRTEFWQISTEKFQIFPSGAIRGHEVPVIKKTKATTMEVN